MPFPLRSLPLLTTLLLAALAPLHAADAPKPKPNIIIHFIDDLGYGDIGPFGAVKQKTPNLDRMAREGMKLTSFYAAPVCSVSRAQILTGCYGARISVPAVYPPAAKNGLHPQEPTIADRLKPLGYATQCIGKWHLGDQPAFLPTKQGFDHYLGIPYSNDMMKTASVDGRRVVPLMRDDQVERLLAEADQDRIEEICTDEAVKFIHSSKDKPFFLYFPHTAVHTPIYPGKAFQGSSENGRFGDWVQEVDASVGRVFGTLRELQLDQNTLVLFTSDNGPWLIKDTDGGSAGSLRGGKGSTWEGGVRVPTLAWWPGKIAPGSVCDAVAGTIDVLPTCLKIAGAEVPAEPVLDGRDLSPLLLGRSKDSPREAHYYFSSYNLEAVRQGPWKLAMATQPESMGQEVSSEANTNPRLYHLDQDIGERTNLASEHPDIVAKLTALAEKMNAEIGGKAPTSRRPAGEVEHPVTLYPTSDKPKERPASKGTAKAEVADLSKLQPGDTLTAEEAPQIADTPFTLTSEITTAQRDAILIAHGGASNGYALHLSGGKLIWTIRHGKTLTTTQTDYPADNRPHRITASLGEKGQLSLQLDQNQTITTTSPGLIPNQPREDFCLGHDNKAPVDAYTAKGKFEGKIAGVRMSPGTLSAESKPELAANPAGKLSSSPNFVVIMVDDMGYSDIGCFGGEVQTPNLDKLAAGGMRFTQFYNTAKCNSTRAELLTGNYANAVSMMSMEYGATFGEVLRGVGYRTLCSGKWHQAPHPMERGFDRYYGLWDGCANSFNQGIEARPGEGKPGRKSPKVIRRWAIEDQMIKGHTSPDPKFYMTDAFTSYAIDRLEEYKGEDKPFLLYLPYTAPHYPLHAWPEDIAKYRGKYKIGWDEIRKQRFARMKQLGIIDDRHQLTPREGRAWDSLTDAEKDEQDLKMAVYAAMIDRVDQNLGRLFAKLKELDEWDNTLILFFSDNGACEEPINNTPDIPPGPVESYHTLGRDWANACNTPYRNFKSTDHEGGIRSPFIAHWPSVIKPGQITDQFGHLIDISATFRDITGAAYPTEINGQKTKPPVGKSLLPVFRGEQREGHEQVFFRFAHANAVRQGDLKAVRYRNGAWELYDLAKDPTEMKNLAEQMPEKTRELAAKWETWSKESVKKP